MAPLGHYSATSIISGHDHAVQEVRYHKPGEKCRHFMISYPDVSLFWYGSDQSMDKGVRIIKIAL